MQKLLFKLAFIIYVILLASSGIRAQQGKGNIEISGVVTDQQTSEPVPFVLVELIQSETDEAIDYVETDNDGRFTLFVKRGTYQLKLYMLGYEDLILPNRVVRDDWDLGEIAIVYKSEQLDEIEISSPKLMFRTNVEGITINPDQNLSNLGGTLLDILRNTPSVSVSDDGSVALRGSNGTNVLINGRNSALTQNLDRIPASAIEQIKIINNPNARYDAQSEAGIIDIILKKGDNLGTNWSVDGLYGTRNRMNAGMQVNHRTIHYNAYAGYNFRQWKNLGHRSVERDIFSENEILNQNTNSSREDWSHNFTFGGDYYFGKNIISYEGMVATSLDEQLNHLYSKLADRTTSDLIQQYVRRNDENETDDRFDNAFIYERVFDQKERSLKIIASQSYTNQFKTQNIDIYRGVSDVDLLESDDQEKAITDEKRYGYIFQLDYIHPLVNNMRIEAGLKSNIRNFNYDYDYMRFDPTMESFIEDPLISNRFDYSDEIHAGYAIFSKASNKFDFMVGVRGEYTVLNTFLYNTNEQNSQNYFNLFPSLQTLYKFTEGHAAKFTYSRRIDRPRAWRLNPFPDITDSLNVRRGNPNLQPEMINSFELGYIYEDFNGGLTANIFFRQVFGQLDFITTIENGISYLQPENLDNAETYGLEVIGFKELTPWWNFTASLTGFGIAVDGTNVNETFTNRGYAFNSKLTTDIKFPYDFSAQIVFNYESPEIEAQGRDQEQYYMDLSFQKSMFDNTLNLSLSIRDLFDTRRFAGFASTDTFIQRFASKRETRIILLSARYVFGSNQE